MAQMNYPEIPTETRYWPDGTKSYEKWELFEGTFVEKYNTFFDKKTFWYFHYDCEEMGMHEWFEKMYSTTKNRYEIQLGWLWDTFV